ncbi:MAG: hypothetical protein IIB38_10715, partial [Candidatus Hydrogenedentes bacterium]|nr:hypothetical protein [Candidatus Hydrogenedentota bacterium]
MQDATKSHADSQEDIQDKALETSNILTAIEEGSLKDQQDLLDMRIKLTDQKHAEDIFKWEIVNGKMTKVYSTGVSAILKHAEDMQKELQARSEQTGEGMKQGFNTGFSGIMDSFNSFLS